MPVLFPLLAGKTFLLIALLECARKMGKIAVATAYTAIAAILLPGGRTLHSKAGLFLVVFVAMNVNGISGKFSFFRILLEF